MEAVKAVNSKIIKCKHNAGVNCSSWTTEQTSAECEKCGWFGKNSEARLNAKGAYWEIQRKKWQKQLQPHKARRDQEAENDKKV